MESFHFVDQSGHPARPVSDTAILLKQGECKILALPMPPGGNVQDLVVKSSRTFLQTVYASPVCSLRDSLQAYQTIADNDQNPAKQTLSATILRTAVPKISRNFAFIQVVGLIPGYSNVTASGGAFDNYASPVSIHVTDNDRQFSFAPATAFDTLWGNHPLQPTTRANKQYPDGDQCKKTVGADQEPDPFGNCMTRFCMALKHSGIDVVRRMAGTRWKCSQDKNHEHHFVQPYDFEAWQTTRNAYVFEASAQTPRPMPGIAAAHFMWGRKGVVLFWHYWSTSKSSSMDGGHIDLWDGTRTGNELGWNDDRGRQDYAFLRARKIVFWPLEVGDTQAPFKLFQSVRFGTPPA